MTTNEKLEDVLVLVDQLRVLLDELIHHTSNRIGSEINGSKHIRPHEFLRTFDNSCTKAQFVLEVAIQLGFCRTRLPSDVVHARVRTVLAEGTVRCVDQFCSNQDPVLFPSARACVNSPNHRATDLPNPLLCARHLAEYTLS